jgi:hypothetical protein
MLALSFLAGEVILSTFTFSAQGAKRFKEEHHEIFIPPPTSAALILIPLPKPTNTPRTPEHPAPRRPLRRGAAV